jgi:hypothetical protein
MKPTARLTGADAPSKLARRLEADMETGRIPRLEGRFKDGRDRAGSPRPHGSSIENGDLRVAPRPEPRSRSGRSR